MLRKFLGVLGVCLVIFSACFVVMAIGDLLGGGDGKTTKSVLLGILTFVLGTGLAGVKLALVSFRQQITTPVITEFDREQKILALAESTDGRLTVPEVA